jgi:hypothetical protein
MSHTSRITALLVLALSLATAATFAQHHGGGSAGHAGGNYHAASCVRSGGYSGGGYGYGGYGYGGYPAFGNDGYAQWTPPNAWGANRYPSENPCQAGCNPDAGYEWDSVGTLILDTNPPQARVSLDGIYAGTTDRLGPFQLPVGEHTLHIEAIGFEPSDIIVRFDKPGVQSLNIELKRLTASAKPGPRQ